MPERERTVGRPAENNAASTEEVDPDVFREIMSSFPAGVTVVTAYGEDGLPQGLTVNAFCSVSLSPPLVLVCIDNESSTLPAIWHSDAFTINFLAAGREELAKRFSSKSDQKFADLSHKPLSNHDGGPILDEDCSAYVVCRTWQSMEAGDHWIFVGRVEDGAFEDGSAPLVYGEQMFAGWDQVREAAT